MFYLGIDQHKSIDPRPCGPVRTHVIMQVITANVGTFALDLLKAADRVRLAVAFFSPSQDVMALLAAVPDLTLIISEEFTINDPYKLDLLPNAEILSVSPDCDSGKLHAKVLIVESANHTIVLLGSANMTFQGLFANQEACIALESEVPEDLQAIAELVRWFESLRGCARTPDLDEAKRIYDAQKMYRLERRPEMDEEVPNYWFMKTTSGSDGMEHWQEFFDRNVLGIGWENLDVDPSDLDDAELADALATTLQYTERQTQRAISSIRQFIGLAEGDIVLIIKGYSSNRGDTVHVYGAARVTGPFRAEPYNGRRWRFLHDAVIQAINVQLPKRDVQAATNKDSMIGTIHSSDRGTFDRMSELLREHGVQVHV